MNPQATSPRRRSLMLGAAATGAAALLQPLSVLAQGADEIVIGGSIPMTGVFAFAGVGINAGIEDYVKIVNDAGGIKGRKVRYVPEDTGYKVDVSVAAFKKITSQNKVNLYYGDSTGFAKTINPELERNGSILMAGASFATELNDPKKYPHQFLVGPDYTEMFGILLKHIAQEKPGAKVAFVYSDSEFGRDPIDSSEALAKQLGLSVAIKIMTPAGSVDVSTEVIKLRRARPDYTIFHGYILAPIPEFITQGKQQGMTSKWMGTFWTMDSSTVMKMGADGDGFMGVMPYRYYYDTERAPMLEKIRAMRPEYQSTAYMQGFLATMLFLESARRCLDGNKLNISTVEDPVEYHLHAANQVQVVDKIGMTFSAALRSLLRQDPDVVMVGEIRDGETARIAVQASLTGHLVLSTLHTNDAPSSITRLINIGVEPYLISASVNGILAQRLVRKICSACKEPQELSGEKEAVLVKAGFQGGPAWHGAGCEKCRQTGYSGRLGIYELLTMDDALRDAVTSNPEVNALRKICRAAGLKTLREDGWLKVGKGLTTVDEVLRVTETG